MKSLNVSISDDEFNQLGLKKKDVSLKELKDIISRQITKKTLEKSTQLAREYGLSSMSMKEINDEIKDHRNE